MKRLLALSFLPFAISMCAPAPITPPLGAKTDPVIEEWNTYHSMGCMMLKECKDGVTPILSWIDLGEQYRPWKDELDKIFSSMNQIGIEAYVADGKYFVSSTRGVYDVKQNNFFLNKEYLSNPAQLVSVIRHEGWHAVQDCMAGTIDNTLTAVVWHDGKVPDWIVRGAEITYETSPKAIPYEAEAMYAAHSNFESADALEVCANPLVDMWDKYPPTPLTGKWLNKNGYIKNTSR